MEHTHIHTHGKSIAKNNRLIIFERASRAKRDFRRRKRDIITKHTSSAIARCDRPLAVVSFELLLGCARLTSCAWLCQCKRLCVHDNEAQSTPKSERIERILPLMVFDRHGWYRKIRFFRFGTVRIVCTLHKYVSIMPTSQKKNRILEKQSEPRHNVLLRRICPHKRPLCIKHECEHLHIRIEN